MSPTIRHNPSHFISKVHHKTSTPEIGRGLSIYIKWVLGEQHTLSHLHACSLVIILWSQYKFWTAFLKEGPPDKIMSHSQVWKILSRVGPVSQCYQGILEYISRVSKEYNIHFFSPEDRTDFGWGECHKVTRSVWRVWRLVWRVRVWVHKIVVEKGIQMGIMSSDITIMMS